MGEERIGQRTKVEERDRELKKIIGVKSFDFRHTEC